MTVFPYVETIDEKLSLNEQVEVMVNLVNREKLLVSKDIEISAYDNKHVTYRIIRKNMCDYYRCSVESFVNVILKRKLLGMWF